MTLETPPTRKSSSPGKAGARSTREINVRREESNIEQQSQIGDRIIDKSAPPDENMIRNWIGLEAFEQLEPAAKLDRSILSQCFHTGLAPWR